MKTAVTKHIPIQILVYTDPFFWVRYAGAGRVPGLPIKNAQEALTVLYTKMYIGFRNMCDSKDIL